MKLFWSDECKKAVIRNGESRTEHLWRNGQIFEVTTLTYPSLYSVYYRIFFTTEPQRHTVEMYTSTTKVHLVSLRPRPLWPWKPFQQCSLIYD